MRFGIPRKTCWIRNTIERSIDQHNSIKGLGKLQFLNFHQKNCIFLMFLIFGCFFRIPHGLPLILRQKSYFLDFPWSFFPNSSWPTSDFASKIVFSCFSWLLEDFSEFLMTFPEFEDFLISSRFTPCSVKDKKTSILRQCELPQGLGRLQSCGSQRFRKAPISWTSDG